MHTVRTELQPADYRTPATARDTAKGSRATTGRRALGTIAAVIALTAASAALPSSLAMASTTAAVCTADQCVVGGPTIETPLGPVTVTVSPADVVVVQLTPTVSGNTAVIGIPFAYPPGPPILPGYARTTITTAAGIINIDTIVFPPGPPNRFALPDIAVVSIHPPSPCHAQTIGTTVTFTPVTPDRG